MTAKDIQLKAINIQWDIDYSDAFESLEDLDDIEIAEYLDLTLDEYKQKSRDELQEIAFAKWEKNPQALYAFIAIETEMEIPHPTDSKWDEDSISDYLTDKTGWCHNGYRITCNYTADELRQNGFANLADLIGPEKPKTATFEETFMRSGDFDRDYMNAVIRIGFQDIYARVPFNLKELTNAYNKGDLSFNSLPIKKWDEATGIRINNKSNVTVVVNPWLFKLIGKFGIKSIAMSQAVCLLKRAAYMMVIASPVVESYARNMLASNEENNVEEILEDDYSRGYYESHHDCILDFMNKFQIDHEDEDFYN